MSSAKQYREPLGVNEKIWEAIVHEKIQEPSSFLQSRHQAWDLLAAEPY